MKHKILTTMAAAVIIIFMTSAALTEYTAKKMYDEIWKQLGITEPDGKKSISSSFLQGHLALPGTRLAKNIAVGNRAAVVTDLLNYAKQYINTPAFIREYEKFRENAKPLLPEPAKSKESIREKFIKDTEDGILKLEKVIAATNDASTKKILGEQIPLQKKTLEDYRLPGNKMIELAWQAEQNNYNWRNLEYSNALKQWATDFPQNHLLMVKARLQQFIKHTDDIDYNAALTERNGKKVFTAQKYEAKDAQWKMAFRAGKEVTETARAMVQQWLKELN